MRKTRSEQVPRKVVYETVCDYCKKAAPGEDPDGWHHFSTGHSDWGNDSPESWEHWDVCSGACYMEILDRAVKDYGPKAPGVEPTFKVVSYDFDLAFAESLLGVAEG